MKESQNVEWKVSWRDDLLRWVSGFANGEGGVLIIGRDDRGQVVGVDNATALLVELPNKIRDLLGVIAAVNLRTEGGRETIEIVTPSYPNPISYRGQYYLRSGSTLQELKGAALDQFLLRRYGRTWDGAPVPGVSASDLSAQALGRFRTLAARSGRLEATALAEPDAALLDKLKLVTGSYLKRAAVLLFHPDPLNFVTGAFIKIGFFRSTTDLVYHDEVAGDLFSQVQQALDLLYTKYFKAAISYEDIVRVERFPVPRDAMREALLNALVHRDYAVPAPLQIRVYDDRLVMVNPATLPEGWTQATLMAPHYSHPFNPEIANTFFRAGEIEAWGRGIQRIFDACREAGSPAPTVRFEANGLWFEFPFAPAYLDIILGRTNGTSTGHVTDQVTDQATGEVTGEVTGVVTGEVAGVVSQEVYQLLMHTAGEMKRVELQSALGLKNENHFRDRYLRPALDQGLLEMTLPHKGRSRLQRYRLTAEGAAVCANRKPQSGSVERLTGEVTGEVTGVVTDQATDEVRQLLSIMAGDMKRQELQSALALKHEEHFRDAYLRPALEGGFIEMTVPDKPTSRLQRYRITASGHAVMKTDAPARGRRHE